MRSDAGVIVDDFAQDDGRCSGSITGDGSVPTIRAYAEGDTGNATTSTVNEPNHSGSEDRQDESGNKDNEPVNDDSSLSSDDGDDGLIFRSPVVSPSGEFSAATDSTDDAAAAAAVAAAAAANFRPQPAPALIEPQRERFLTAYERLSYELANDRRCQKEITLGKRIGFYQLRSQIGSGNFSYVKLGVHILTRGKATVAVGFFFSFFPFCVGVSFALFRLLIA
jgi:hypothetical protein